MDHEETHQPSRDPRQPVRLRHHSHALDELADRGIGISVGSSIHGNSLLSGFEAADGTFRSSSQQ